MTYLNDLRQTCRRIAPALPLVALVAFGCGGDSSQSKDVRVPATLMWSLAPQTILPVMPQDMKATDGGIVWVADDVKDAVIRLDVPNNSFQMFGHDDTPPLEIDQPWRIAVAPELGIVTFDGTSRNIDLFTPGGQHIRSFTPEFAPSFMDLTRRPISLVAASRATGADSTQHLLILASDMIGRQVDTLVGPNHGPESLRLLSPDPVETALAGSDEGLWVWTKTVADTVYGIRIQGTPTKLALRSSDVFNVGIMFDRALGILWLIQPDAEGLAYVGYDVSAGGLVDGEAAYLGTRTTPDDFTPVTAHEGILFGSVPDGMAALMTGYDLLVDQLDRHSEP